MNWSDHVLLNTSNTEIPVADDRVYEEMQVNELASQYTHACSLLKQLLNRKSVV
jgi:hypothetical protein